MNCYCENEGQCMHCRDEQEWSRLTDANKSKLIIYSSLLAKDMLNIERQEHFELSEYILDNDLCVSIVPRRYYENALLS